MEIEFEENSFESSNSVSSSKNSDRNDSRGLISWLVKNGLVKDQKRAIYLLAVFVFITLLASLIILYLTYKNSTGSRSNIVRSVQIL